jgi:RimJ/RimL family protein N-acetyltransferase
VAQKPQLKKLSRLHKILRDSLLKERMIERRKAVRLRCRMDQLSSGSPDLIDGCGMGNCGSIGFRWQPGTAELPPHVLGHIGFSVLPWKRGRKYATKALGLMLKETQAEGLPMSNW